MIGMILLHIDTIKAKFLKEGHNRFIAFIELDNKIIECYVPSSAKMSNFLRLNGKEILITKNSSSSKRTKYSLFAVKYYNKYIILNLNLVNKLVAKYLSYSSPNYDFILEKTIDNYKTDIVMKSPTGDLTLIEAKGIISTQRSCVFPIKSSDRAYLQLVKIDQLLGTKNFQVDYYLVSLGPITKKVEIIDTESEYIKLLKRCLLKGMQLKGISVEYNNNKFIFKELPVKLM